MPSESDTPRPDWWERTLIVASRIQPLAVVVAAVGAPVVLTAALLPFRSQVSTATVALGLAVLAVSYTHLDVYKRQPVSRLAFGAIELRSTSIPWGAHDL